MDCANCRPLLGAFLDQELGGAEQALLQRHLPGCPACRQQIQNLQQLSRSLQEQPLAPPDLGPMETRILAALRAESAPPAPALAAAPVAAPPRPVSTRAERWRRLWPTLGAATLAALAGCLVTLLALHESPAEQLGDVAVSAYLRSVHAADGTAPESADAGQMAVWLQQRLQHAVPVPDLQRDGFQLVGARVDFLYHQQVGALIYERGQHRVEVFIWPQSTGPDQRSTLRDDSLAIRLWSRHGLNFCAVTDLDEAALTRFTDGFNS
jgi:anti-sigma factor RsiW